MIIIVYGSDQCRVQKKAEELEKAFQQKHDASGFNTTHFKERGKDISLSALGNAVKSFPFLGTKRFVIARDVLTTANQEHQETLFELAKTTPDSTIFVLWESIDEKTLEKKKWFADWKALKDVYLYTFPTLTPTEAARWIKTFVKEHNGGIDDLTARFLVERAGYDTQTLTNELQKLLALHKSNPITKQSIEHLVRPQTESDVFPLMDALSNRNEKETFTRLNNERANGTDAFSLFGMFVRQIRILLSIRSILDENPNAQKTEIASRTKLHPFVAEKGIGQAKKFTLQELMSIHDQLFQLDKQMKTGEIQGDTAIDLLTAIMTQQKNRP